MKIIHNKRRKSYFKTFYIKIFSTYLLKSQKKMKKLFHFLLPSNKKTYKTKNKGTSGPICIKKFRLYRVSIYNLNFLDRLLFHVYALKKLKKSKIFVQFNIEFNSCNVFIKASVLSISISLCNLELAPRLFI